MDENSKADKIEKFDQTWEALSKVGSCDSIGGMEYERVKREWLEFDMPEPIASFITIRTNDIWPYH